jgi:hypothetical protein
MTYEGNALRLSLIMAREGARSDECQVLSERKAADSARMVATNAPRRQGGGRLAVKQQRGADEPSQAAPPSIASRTSSGNVETPSFFISRARRFSTVRRLT